MAASWRRCNNNCMEVLACWLGALVVPSPMLEWVEWLCVCVVILVSEETRPYIEELSRRKVNGSSILLYIWWLTSHEIWSSSMLQQKHIRLSTAGRTLLMKLRPPAHAAAPRTSWDQNNNGHSYMMRKIRNSLIYTWNSVVRSAIDAFHLTPTKHAKRWPNCLYLQECVAYSDVLQ
jgi:hypothetical protein